MMNKHESFFDQLVDCLGGTDRPLALLLGAGCPCSVRINDEPLIPDLESLTSKIENNLSGSEEVHSTYQEIKGQEKIARSSDDPNVELILSRVRSLLSLVGSGTIGALTAKELSRLEKRICQEIVNQTNRSLPDRETPYHQVAKWVSAVPRPRPLEIFTTNYDLLIEEALEQHRVPYSDGFVGSVAPFFDESVVDSDTIPRSWLRLWKLHGSINWARSETTGNIIRTSGREGLLVYPSHLKYDQSRKMPYMAMMDRLRRHLATPDSVLVTSGFSFCDDHIADLVASGLRANPTGVIFALMFDRMDRHPEAVSLARSNNRLRLHARDGSIIGGVEHSLEVSEVKPESNLPPYLLDWKECGGQFSPKSNIGDFAALGSLMEQVTEK